MIRRMAALCLASLCFGPWAAATAADLSPEGVDFGRRPARDLAEGLSLAVSVPATAPEHCFVIARFQDNRPLMRDADGRWRDWAGDPAALADSGCRREGQDLVFELVSKSLADMTFPVVFTFGYRFQGDTRSGFITVDEP